jgi:hypothetical protein
MQLLMVITNNFHVFTQDTLAAAANQLRAVSARSSVPNPSTRTDSGAGLLNSCANRTNPSIRPSGSGGPESPDGCSIGQLLNPQSSQFSPTFKKSGKRL